MAKLTFNVDEMLPNLAQVVGVVNSKNPIPILGNVVLQTRSDVGLTITASDSETWLTIKTPCIEFDEPMMFCVLASDIFRALSNLKGKVVTVELDEETHTLKGSYEKGHFALPFESAKDFPRPTMDMSDSLEKTIGAPNLFRTISKTEFGIANDKLRPIMNGIHFDFLPQGMVACATDGQKLAKYTDCTVVLGDDETAKGFTLPKKPAIIMLGLLNGLDADVHVVFNDKCVSFGNADFKMITRLLEGNYPNYDRVIPIDNNVETVVSKSEFTEALKRVLPMGDASSQLVKLSFSMGVMTISSEDFNFSKSADESIDCDYSSGEMAIGFNGGYLMDVLSNIDGDNVKICLKNQSSSGLFKPAETHEAEDYVSLLMPIFV